MIVDAPSAPSANAARSVVVSSAPAGVGSLREQTLAALGTVLDPELDTPITELDFIASIDIGGGGEVGVHLRLPTYFCAPNFAFLMVADAYDALAALAWSTSVSVILDDHFASDAINSGVAARAGFRDTFAAEAAGELDQLRADFVRKAVTAGTYRVCRPLTAAGASPERLAAMTLGEVPDSAELRKLRARRREVGLPAADDALLLIDAVSGERVEPKRVALHLGRARLSQVNIEANSSICQGMLASRYPQRFREESA